MGDILLQMFLKAYSAMSIYPREAFRRTILVCDAFRYVSILVSSNAYNVYSGLHELVLCSFQLLNLSWSLSSSDRSNSMAWGTCFKIIKGICNGLLFLHRIPIIHMDLKPENILLDDNMNPKIADFGLSRLFGQEQTRANTQNVVGS